jgi:diacylglycerol kinase family enzyme
LGFIPVRSQSETAKILGIGDLLESVITIAKRRVESLDLACVGQTYFISSLFFRTDRIQAATEAEPEDKSLVQSRSFRGLLGGLKAVWSPQAFHAVEIRFDRSFKASGDLFLGSIINASDHLSQQDGVIIGNPKDGLFDIVLVGRLNRFQHWQYRKIIDQRALETIPGATIVHAREVEILAPTGLQLFLGSNTVATAPTRIFLSQNKLRVIVGKSRTF